MNSCYQDQSCLISGSNLYIIQAWVSIWLGANRFVHSAVLRHDSVLQKIFGWKRCPSDNTYVRFFKKLDIEKSCKLFYDLGQWFLGPLKFDHFTLDVYSSV